MDILDHLMYEHLGGSCNPAWMDVFHINGITTPHDLVLEDPAVIQDEWIYYPLNEEATERLNKKRSTGGPPTTTSENPVLPTVTPRTPRSDYVLKKEHIRIPISLARNIVYLIDAARTLAQSLGIPALITTEEWALLTKTYFLEHKIQHGSFRGASPFASRLAAGVQQGMKHPTSGSSVELFKKGIRRSTDTFPKLNDDLMFQRWADSMITQARAQDVEEVLDASYTPFTSEEKTLFAEKQKYMMSVLDLNVKTDRGKNVIRSFARSGDAQGAYSALVAANSSSTAGKITATELRKKLSTKLLDSTWRGTQEGFLISWQAQLRQYENMTDPSVHFTDPLKKVLLQNALSPQANLQQAQVVESNLTALGHPELSYEQYFQSVTSLAQRFDTGNPRSVRRSANETHFSYADHGELYWDASNGEDSSPLQVHSTTQRPNRGPSKPPRDKPSANPLFLSGEQWKSLSGEDQEHLRRIRKQLLQQEQQRALQYAKACERAANSTTIVGNLGEEVTDTATIITDNSTSDSNASSAFLSMYQAGQTLDPLSFAALVANTHQFDNTPDTSQADRRSINTTYRVSTHEHNEYIGALVDRGANGCLCGRDTLHTDLLPNRFVSITGLKNTTMSQVPIGTAIGLVHSTTGKTLCVFPQAAVSNEVETSILSPLQMEMYGLKVDDRSRIAAGKQRIHTTDGYRYGLHIRNGLPYLDMRKPTPEELDDESIPTVFMCSPFDWNPTCADATFIDDDPEAPRGDNNPFGYFWAHSGLNPPQPDEYSPHNFDPLGRYNPAKAMQYTACHALFVDSLMDNPLGSLELASIIPYAVHHTEISFHDDFNLPFSHFDSLIEDIDLSIFTQAQHRPDPPDYKALRPLLAFAPEEVIQHTLENTTRFARLENRLPMRKHWKSRYPGLNVSRRNEPVSTDTIFSDTPAIDDGSKAAQIFIGKFSKVRDAYGIKSDGQFVATLEDNIRKRGAMDQLISDRAKAETSNKTKDILRSYAIKDWQSEPHHQHQNPAERGILEIKDKVNLLMDYSGAPAYCWLLCLQYVCLVLNCLASRHLGWRTPIQVLTGSRPDISSLLCFTFYEPVYYSSDETLNPSGKPSWPSSTKEHLGYFVGVADTVGDALTFKVLTHDSKRVIERSAIRTALDPSTANQRARLFSNLGEGDRRPSEEVVQLAQLQGPTGNFSNTETPECHHFDPDSIIGRTFLLDNPETGDRDRVTIAERLEEHQSKGIPIHYDPSNIQYLIDMGEKGKELMAYGEVIDHINRNISDGLEDNMWVYERIISHHGPYQPQDPEYQGSMWNVSVELSDMSRHTIPLSLACADDPIPCALYAQEQKLLSTPGWKRFRQIIRRHKKLQRQIKAAKRKSFSRATVYKFGYEVPTDYQRAIKIDEEAGNTKWADATKLEMNQVCVEYQTFKDLGKGTKAPDDYKKITAHLVFDVKHDGRHKARLVAGGHLTSPPKDAVYSGVVSIRSIRIITFLAELNSLQLWAADVGNAYLESYTKEKVYIIGGPEFISMGMVGHTLLIHRALYGLRSSGARWNERFADILRNEGWIKSRADGEVWLRRNGQVYEYIAVYVDDLLIAMKDPESFTNVLKEKYKLKLKGVGPLQYHLGCDFIRDPDGTLGSGPHKYIKKMEATFKRLFPTEPIPKVSSPLEPNDHPELDTSADLTPEGVQTYYTMIGELQWLVTLGRFDIFSAVTTMGRFRTEPHEQHLNRLKRIYGYVIRTNDHRIRYRVEVPKHLASLPNETYDWCYSVYGNVKEGIPADAPEPLGRPVCTVTYVDANLHHCHTTGRALTGILHFVNGTPIDWIAKRQATVETATYGSEFVAARIATEQIIDLRTTLRYLGVPIVDSHMFGDNASVITSSTIPHSSLNKRHNALSYHRVREAIAACILRFHHCPGKDNPADILSKHWAFGKVHNLIRLLFQWKGVPSTASDDPTEVPA